MSKRIGIVQTRGIGDLIMALPIADHFLEQGAEVFWPIDQKFVHMFQPIKPEINFLPVDGTADDGRDFFLNKPLQLINENKCDRTIILYSHLGGLNICDTRLFESVKFDEYKYAIAGVPFDRKWKLKYTRNMAREESLYENLGIKGDYVCVHEDGSDLKIPIPIPPDIQRDFQIIKVNDVTDSPFDWLLTFERASKLIMIDSCFSNLVEQMNLPNEKRLYLRSIINFTPVYKNGWRFMFFNPADAQ
ncbi:MAG: hypothetical protein ABI539_14690 [Acidobacteriota bacterium]